MTEALPVSADRSGPARVADGIAEDGAAEVFTKAIFASFPRYNLGPFIVSADASTIHERNEKGRTSLSPEGQGGPWTEYG